MIASLVLTTLAMLEANDAMICHGRASARAGFFHLRARVTQRTTLAAPACPQFATAQLVAPTPMQGPTVTRVITVASVLPEQKAAAPVDLEPRVAALERRADTMDKKLQDAGRALLFNAPTASAPPVVGVTYAAPVYVRSAPASVQVTRSRQRLFTRHNGGNCPGH